TQDIHYLMADDERRYKIAPATIAIGKDGRIKDERVQVRTGKEEVHSVLPDEVDFIEISPDTIVGVSTALIPFLE
ncbi:TPA: hypothetical protein DCY67_02970, partial [Candidatus Acetothermia bacterium]|nr:hypothetical protein [Candidatus Acetothermia bacterium]